MQRQRALLERQGKSQGSGRLGKDLLASGLDSGHAAWSPVKGDLVVRKGVQCTVVHVDRSMRPWGYTVRLPDGREVSTELSRLTPPPAAAAAAAAGPAAGGSSVSSPAGASFSSSPSSSSSAARQYNKGDAVIRKGVRCVVTHVDRSLTPWGYTVRTPDGREISTEGNRLEPAGAGAAAAAAAAAPTPAAAYQVAPTSQAAHPALRTVSAPIRSSSADRDGGGGGGGPPKVSRRVWRAKIANFYADHNVAKTLADVDSLLDRYQGKEEAVWARLHKKYGEPPDAAAAGAPPAVSVKPQQQQQQQQQPQQQQQQPRQELRQQSQPQPITTRPSVRRPVSTSRELGQSFRAPRKASVTLDGGYDDDEYGDEGGGGGEGADTYAYDGGDALVPERRAKSATFAAQRGRPSTLMSKSGRIVRPGSQRARAATTQAGGGRTQPSRRMAAPGTGKNFLTKREPSVMF